MAFDAGMLCAVLHELNTAADARVEKIQQPQKDEIVFTLHSAARRENIRLAINAGANSPKIYLTAQQKENPATAPMLCMLLRKQLGGGRFVCARQIGFDRVAELEFTGRDELGFSVTRFLIVEIMGKYSNLFLTDENKKIIAAMRWVDFSTSRLRQVLPGMVYALPPSQGKNDIFALTKDELAQMISACEGSMPVWRFILSRFSGISPLVARELAYRVSGTADGTLETVLPDRLFSVFMQFRSLLETADFKPVLLYDAEGVPFEFCFMDILQYGDMAQVSYFPDMGTLLDAYFEKRDAAERIRRLGQDIAHLLSGARARLARKLETQREELAACADGDTYKLYGDLITANLYMMQRGMKHIRVPNYYSEAAEEVTIMLDPRLTPAQNAQRMYKKYSKSKNAKVYLGAQIDLAEAELRYLDTVTEALQRAEIESDLNEIRMELSQSGYVSRISTAKNAKRTGTLHPMEFRSASGYRILCGKNNLQNEHITFKVAGKSDLWFHVKDRPGSHVILICDGEEPSEEDYTQAAVIAATYSSAGAQRQIPVDYTRVKNIKRPPASRPGYVTYSTNFTAYVGSDVKFCERLRVR